MNSESARLEIAMAALNLALQTLSMLGYELDEKIHFKKKEEDVR